MPRAITWLALLGALALIGASRPYVVALMTDLADPKLDQVALAIVTGPGCRCASASACC